MKKSKKLQTDPFAALPDVLDVAQLRGTLNIGRGSAYKLLNEGKIASFKLGNTYRIPKSALIEFIEQSIREGGN